MKITKIISDGTAVGTRILLENGAFLDGVVRMHWWIDGDNYRSEATLTMKDIPLELITDNSNISILKEERRHEATIQRK